MRAVVKEEFFDIKEGVVRSIGDVFECDKARFDEIAKKLPGFIKEVRVSRQTKK